MLARRPLVIVPLTAMHTPMLLSSCGPFGVIPDGVCSLFGGVSNGLSQAVEVIQNPFRWLYHHTLGAPVPQHAGDPGWEACQADWTQRACPKVIDRLHPGDMTLSDTWPRLYSALAVSGVFIALTGCAVRVIRAVFDEGTAAMHMVTDAVTRVVVAGGLLVAPSPGSSVLLGVMRLCAAASTRIADAAGNAAGSAFGGSTDLGSAVGAIAATAFGFASVGDFLVAIPVLLAALAFVYVLALSLLRVVQLVFAVASAPIFVAIAVYDTRSRFVQWWVDLFTSAMVLPLVLAFCGALTAGIAETFLGRGLATSPVEAAVRTMLASFAILGGVWMTGKAVHGLAWRSFSHGGVTGAITALSTSVMALPNVAADAGRLLRLGGGASGGTPSGRAGATAGGGRPGLAAGAGAMAPGVLASALAGATVAAGGNGQHRVAVGPRVADYASHTGLAELCDDAGLRTAFNGVVADAVDSVASRGTGLAGQSSAAAVAADPALAGPVATATLASLLHGQRPDLAGLVTSAATSS